MKNRLSYNHTVAACSISYAVQAIVNNYAPLLFVTYNKVYNISLEKIALLITVNFLTQLAIDLLSALFADKIGYRRLILMAHIFSIVGFWSLSILPELIEPFAGLLISVMIYGIGGGLLEVLISPVVEAGPSEKKSSVMSFLHSFYSWGQLIVVLLSTLFFSIFGIENRAYLTIIWTIIPILNMIYFCFVPINTLEDKKHGMSVTELLKDKVFYQMLILMICSGACELGMSQWASAFAESGLNVTKTIGDILGPCMFALFMGCSRLFYSIKGNGFDLEKYTLFSAILCMVGYFVASLSENPLIALSGCAICGFSVGVMWPGTYVIAHKKIPKGGTALFALLALAGDAGCTAGPTFIGFISGAFNDNLRVGIFFGSIFSVIMIILLFKSLYFKHKSTI
ncbi:MAG: MFS transporter [Clostridia bacterium]|nr:MFS transporter [Clostridia bacterium]